MPKKRKSKVKEENTTKKLVQQTSSEKNFESLLEAIEKNDIELVEKIIEEEKIDIKNFDDGEGGTVLHFAAEKNNLELLKLFVDKYEGDINAVDENNWSVFHSVASGIIHEKEDWSIIEWMLEKGAKTDIKAANGFHIENVFQQKDWSYAEEYKKIVANFMKKKESREVTEMEVEEIEAQIEMPPSS